MLYLNYMWHFSFCNGRFPNGEGIFKNLKRAIFPTLNVINLIYRDDSELFALGILMHYIKDNYPDAKCILDMPFCPYGQADRPMGENIFTMKYFAKYINSLGFSEVRILDPHSPVMIGCLDRVTTQYPIEEIEFRMECGDTDLLFYPDNGAAKKYSEVYEGVPYGYGIKKRELSTGKILSYECSLDRADVEGKKILIVDDLIVKGSTYKYAAKLLNDLGAAEVNLFITHIMPSAEEFCKTYKEYGITNFISIDTLRTGFLD